jgi:hypothetical protein
MKRFYSLVACAALVSTLLSCSKKENDPNPELSSTKDFYFLATVDGKSIKYEGNTVPTSISEYGSGGASSGSSVDINQDGVSEGYAEIQSSVLTTYPIDKNHSAVSLVKIFPSQPTDSQIEGMFQVKSFEYGKVENGSQQSQEGASVTITDEAGVQWASHLGTGEQSGSTFKITSVIDNPDPNSKLLLHKIVTYEFNCKLYDGKGNTKTLTNGKMRSRAVLY